MKIASILTGVCAGTLLLSGCMTEEPVTQRATEERIELIGNDSFKIELLDAKTLIDDNGLLTVDATTVISRTAPLRWVFAGDPKITVWYHFDWIDAKGNIRPPVQHEMVALPGNIVSFHGIAPEEKYINYHLTISLKGPVTQEETAKQQNEVKKQVAESGKVNPAGKSQAKKTKPGKKSKAKTASKKNAQKKDAAKKGKGKAAPKKKADAPKNEPVEKVAEAPVEKVAETPKSEPVEKVTEAPVEKTADAPEKAPAGTGKQQKLTEPFD